MSSDDDWSKTLHKIALGRAAVLEKAPYVADTLLSLSPVVVEHGTMAVTRGLVLYANPDWVLRSGDVDSDQRMAAILRHEIEHPLRGFDRLEALPDHDLANLAGDLAINWDLREEGWDLPPCGQFPEKFDLPGGKTLEWYYDQLQKKRDKDPNALGQPDDGSSGKPIGVTQGSCGSCGGHAEDSEVEAQLDAEHGKSEAEVEAIRRQTLETIEQHIQAHGRGSVPGRYEELIKTRIKPPEVNWRQKLHRVTRRCNSIIQTGGRDYSIRRPSMMGMFTGAVLSGLVDYPVETAVIEDTSLSMGAPQLESAHNESFHAVKRLGVEKIWFIQADTQVQRCERISPRRIPHLSFKGRGGTDFRRVLDYVQKLKPRPNLVIYLTDGDGVAPKRAPRGMEVIWCIVRTSHARRPALWGHVVVCDSNQALAEPVILDD